MEKLQNIHKNLLISISLLAVSLALFIWLGVQVYEAKQLEELSNAESAVTAEPTSEPTEEPQDVEYIETEKSSEATDDDVIIFD